MAGPGDNIEVRQLIRVTANVKSSLSVCINATIAPSLAALNPLL
jgi:hypothetical protein